MGQTTRPHHLSLDIPRYLQLLALTSYHVFISEHVDVAIYEIHLGEEYDATNIVRNPVITAVISIAMDHVKPLGPTIEEIAWHKAGIFKRGSLAFSTVQLSAVALEKRAIEKQVELEFDGIDPTLPINKSSLVSTVQRLNCSLSFAVVRTWLLAKAPKVHSELSSDDCVSGVESFSGQEGFSESATENLNGSLMEHTTNQVPSMRYNGTMRLHRRHNSTTQK